MSTCRALLHLWRSLSLTARRTTMNTHRGARTQPAVARKEFRQVGGSVVKGLEIRSVDRGLMHDLAIRRVSAERSFQLSEEPVFPTHGVGHPRIETGSIMREKCIVELKSQAFGFLDNPVQRFVCQSIGRGAPTDVGVHARKPSLLEDAVPVRRTLPNVGSERLAVLVYG